MGVDVGRLDAGCCIVFSQLALGHGGTRHWHFGLGVDWFFDVHLLTLKSSF